MKSLFRYAAAAALMLSVSFAARAAEGYVAEDLTLYAGPDVDYPEVAYVPAGTFVTIWGCDDAYAWCDVSVDEDRGWVSGEAIQYEYDNRWVGVHEYGPRIGVPIVAFVLGAYWGSHYHHYGWYGERDLWLHSAHGHRPHGHYVGHYIPEHRYGAEHHLPPSYQHIHHSNEHYAGSHHGESHTTDRYSHHDPVDHHGTPYHHSGSDHRSGSYVNHSEPTDHHGMSTGHYAGPTSDHHGGPYVNRSEPIDHHSTSTGHHTGSTTDHHGGPYVNRSEPIDHHGTSSHMQSATQQHVPQHSGGQPQQYSASHGHGQPQGHGQAQGQGQGHERQQGQSKQHDADRDHKKGDPSH